MASVEFRAVTKSFGNTQILKHISAKIPDGAFTVLVGPSGCGKSTLLRLLAGLETPTSGEILIDATDVSRTSPQDRDIAMVFQSYALYPHMTVAQNMGFALKLRKVDRAEIDGRVREAAAKLSLEHLLDRLPRQLSGGQRQRVAMGRAIVRDPKVFLFDEPLSNLDAKLRVQMRSEIRALHQSLGSTSIYVTHDQVEAMTMADVIMVLNQGEIAQAGPPQQLYDDPDNRFVAEFIGSPAMNFLQGFVERGVWTGENGLRLSLSGDAALKDGHAVTLGVRPEHISLSGGQDGFAMRALTVENTGADVHLRGVVGEDTLTLITKPPVAIRPGDTVGLTLEPAKCLFFDTASEERLRMLSAVRA
jgi:multiple sugar transport system ATP-binding protein